MVKELLGKWRTSRRLTQKKRVEQLAEELFQVTEYQHGLWLTYNGSLFCPVKLVREKSDDAVALIETLRKLYIERNTGSSELQGTEKRVAV